VGERDTREKTEGEKEYRRGEMGVRRGIGGRERCSAGGKHRTRGRREDDGVGVLNPPHLDQRLMHVRKKEEEGSKKGPKCARVPFYTRFSKVLSPRKKKMKKKRSCRKRGKVDRFVVSLYFWIFVDLEGWRRGKKKSSSEEKKKGGVTRDAGLSMFCLFFNSLKMDEGGRKESAWKKKKGGMDTVTRCRTLRRNVRSSNKLREKGKQKRGGGNRYVKYRNANF